MEHLDNKVYNFHLYSAHLESTSFAKFNIFDSHAFTVFTVNNFFNKNYSNINSSQNQGSILNSTCNFHLHSTHSVTYC